MYSLSQQDTSRDNRLNMLVESRVRREVQARFGGEFLETYRRNTARHRVLSLRLTAQYLVLFNPADGARIVAERIEPSQLAGGDCSVTFEAQGSISPATDGVDVLRGSIGFGNSADGKASEADFTLHYKLTTK